MIWMMKLLHLTTISIWSGGLVAVPFLLRQRHGLTGEPLHRLHGLVRMLYVKILSPTAFVAIASGTALIFMQASFVEWFSLKLVFVGMLVALHVRLGLLILRVFDPGGRLSPAGAGMLTGGTVTAVVLVLLMVLWKPQIDAGALAPGLFRPGALAEFLAPITAWVSP